MSSHAHNSCLATNLTQATDPTHTLEVRQAFLQDIRGRFRRVSGVIRRTIGYENDAFGLSENDKLGATDSYDYSTDSGKIQEFIEDLNEWIQGEILEPANFTELREGDHWTSSYITNSYVIARNVAVGRLKQEGVSASAWTADELTQTRTSLKTLRDLYSRTYENLEDITDDMADVVRRELTQGFAEGRNPKAMAKSITDRLDDIQKQRAETLARTETINAATRGQLDEMERGGVDVVGHGSWLTAMDEDVCSFCRRVGGENFTVSEFKSNHAVRFRGQVYRLAPPAHPNCRGAINPVVGLSADDLEPLQERVPGELLS